MCMGMCYACVSLSMSPVKKMCVLVLEKKVRRVSCCGELCCRIGALGRFVFIRDFMEVSVYF
jgi:hypothetical protein